ncbi:MAG TPA: sigma-70 family RNA polymerase sigma factor [Ktedonobacteraceae bacterium]
MGLRFEQLILPHLDAAYNLARWLTHDDQDAQDMVQEACLRAYRFLPSFRGGNSRAWLLTIVRNTCYTWLHQQHTNEVFDEQMHDVESEALDPELIYLHEIDQEKLKEAIETLPVELREVIVLRELEELSYKEISAMAHIPMGTVMSRLSHARKRLQRDLARRAKEEEKSEL